jgi:hypothetical protein
LEYDGGKVRKSKLKKYRSIEEYQLAVDGFHGFCGLLLFAFAKYSLSTKDLIIRNFIARTDVMVRAVMSLWHISDFQDCWILNRCLLDRLFHLAYLGERNEFDIFDDWSFFEQYKAQNRVRSDPDFRGAVKSQMFTPSSLEKKRYGKLLQSPPKWKRPKAEDIAKKMKLGFLYKYGYDFGSTHVHPMANDGQQDFFTITRLKPEPEFPDQRSVLSNSILVGCMIVQKGLNLSSFGWQPVAFDFLDHLLEHLEDGSGKYGITLSKISQIAQQVGLCGPATLT